LQVNPCAAGKELSFKKEGGLKYAKAVGAIVLFASMNSFALLDIQVGGGLNLSTEVYSKDRKLPAGVTQPLLAGFNTGANVAFLFGPIGVAGGVNFETRGDAQKTSAADAEKIPYPTSQVFSMYYLQIPVHFVYVPIPGLHIGIGPEFGLFLGGTSDIEGLKFDMQEINPIDFGASVTVDYTIFNMIAVGAGYYWGFLNSDNSSTKNVLEGTITHRNIKLFAAYVIHI
jgi:hypothetical protein